MKYYDAQILVFAINESFFQVTIHSQLLHNLQVVHLSNIYMLRLRVYKIDVCVLS